MPTPIHFFCRFVCRLVPKRVLCSNCCATIDPHAVIDVPVLIASKSDETEIAEVKGGGEGGSSEDSEDDALSLKTALHVVQPATPL